VYLYEAIDRLNVNQKLTDSDMSKQPTVTLIVTQRERFSLTQASLDSILADYESYPFQLIYVDGNSPPETSQYLQEQAQKYPFMTLIRKERYLRSNTARNLALPLTQSADYVAFLDNDVIVEPGWLKTLVDCAEAEQAGIVSPLILQGQPGSPDIEVHVAGIKTKFRKRKWGKRWFEQKQLLYATQLKDVEHTLYRTTVDSIEFHCILVRRSYLESARLDEVFDSLAGHTDLCFQVKALGGKVFLEPTSKVTFLNPRQITGFTREDVNFYMFKWNDPFVRKNFVHSARKWGLGSDDPTIWSIWRWVIENRQIPATLATQEGTFLRKLLEISQKRWCPPHLRMLLESFVLKKAFPATGIPSNLDLNQRTPLEQSVS
jgi:glycosyltransferase involved in cell wall biosynthesis